MRDERWTKGCENGGMRDGIGDEMGDGMEDGA